METQDHKIPTRIVKWLKDRGISEMMIHSRKLGWNGTHLVIPIFGKDGKVLFNKFRKDPEDLSDAPKYLYEKGACAALYGVDSKFIGTVVLCEGELDAIRLMSSHIHALSTTGGSSTFLDEWVEELKHNDVLVCYDSDEAGTKGALKVIERLPNARVVVLPTDTKDVTDYLLKHRLADFYELMHSAHSYPLPKEPEMVIEKKADMKRLIDDYRKAAEWCVLEMRKATRGDRPDDHRILMRFREVVLNKYDHYQRLLKSFDRTGVKDGSKIVQAKQVPITRFIKFNGQKFAKCLWHDEKSASLKYNDERSKMPNTVHCFGCGYNGDCIDVVMQLQQLSFKDAINLLVS